jgi:DNA replication and repair protein RecF
LTGIAAISTSAVKDPSPVLIPTGSHGRRVAVQRISVTDYRNYAHASFKPGGANVVLTGANGVGKTNLLEAVSFLAPGRGLRRVRLDEVARKDSGDDANASTRPWAVAVSVDGDAGPVDIGTGLDPDHQGVRERRVVRVDGQPEKNQSVLADHIAVVWLTPQMDGLFIDGPGARRRFLDRLVYVSDAAHAGRVTAYEKAMRDRARLLSEQGAGADAGWLDALEGVMVEKGMSVAAARRDMIGRLRVFIAESDGPFPRAEISLSGGPDAWLDDMPALAAEDQYRDLLRSDRARDASDGRTATGPHRTDLLVRHAEKARDAAICSTGEQKALLIGLILAHARMQAAEQGRRPVILLDEVAAHLDQDRRQALFDLLCDLDTQVWMTGTDPALFSGMQGRARFFTVSDGAVDEQ